MVTIHFLITVHAREWRKRGIKMQTGAFYIINAGCSLYFIFTSVCIAHTPKWSHTDWVSVCLTVCTCCCCTAMWGVYTKDSSMWLPVIWLLQDLVIQQRSNPYLPEPVRLYLAAPLLRCDIAFPSPPKPNLEFWSFLTSKYPVESEVIATFHILGSVLCSFLVLIQSWWNNKKKMHLSPHMAGVMRRKMELEGWERYRWQMGTKAKQREVKTERMTEREWHNSHVRTKECCFDATCQLILLLFEISAPEQTSQGQTTAHTTIIKVSRLCCSNTCATIMFSHWQMRLLAQTHTPSWMGNQNVNITILKLACRFGHLMFSDTNDRGFG